MGNRSTDWPALFWKRYLDQSITDENADRSYLSGNLAGENVVVSMTKLSFCYTQALQFSPWVAWNPYPNVIKGQNPYWIRIGYHLKKIRIGYVLDIISKKAKIRIGYGRSVPCGMSGSNHFYKLTSVCVHACVHALATSSAHAKQGMGWRWFQPVES